jgi:hypothetical protein
MRASSRTNDFLSDNHRILCPSLWKSMIPSRFFPTKTMPTNLVWTPDKARRRASHGIQTLTISSFDLECFRCHALGTDAHPHNMLETRCAEL